MNKATLAAAAAGVLTAVGLSLGLASHAHADTDDDIYLMTLAAAGIFGQSDSAAIDAGHGVCTLRAAGFSDGYVESLLHNHWSMAEAAYIVGAAEASYCPGYLGHTGSQLA